MERVPPALAADDHPPSPPPPPTPAPPSEPPTPADHPTPLEQATPQPDSPPPIPSPRPVRRSARIRGDSDPGADEPPPASLDTRNASTRRQLKRVSTDDTAADPQRLSPDRGSDPDNPPPDDTAGTTSLQEVEKPRDANDDSADQDDNDPTKQRSESDPHPDPDAEQTLDANANPGAEQTPDANANPDAEKMLGVEDAETQNPEESHLRKDTDNVDIPMKNASDANDLQNDEPENPEALEAPKDVSASEEGAKDKPDSTDDARNGDDDYTQVAPAVPEASDEPNTEAEAADPLEKDMSPDRTDAPERSVTGADENAASPTAEKPTDAENTMDVDLPEKSSEAAQPPEDSAMDVEPRDEPVESTENPPDQMGTEKEATGPGKKKSDADSLPALTDSDDEIRQGQDEISKVPSPPPLSPPRTRRRLATRTPSEESHPATSAAPLNTPKTAPHKSSRRSESSDDIAAAIEKPSSRYETRSSTRQFSPVRTRRRRHSEPAGTVPPVVKPRTRRAKRYARKPVKGDRLRVLWHIDNIYYEGVVDSVLAFRGKRFYDITYDSGEREYYLELTHRKWRFADGRDGDDEDEEEEEQSVPRDIDYSKYPQIGDRILVMWHVDGKYYPGTVNDILKANGAWFYDVNYEGGDREFFLDLTIRKWKYPEMSEETAKHPLVDRKIPKPQPKPKAKPRPKPKPKRAARKTIGPGSSSFAGRDSPSQSPPRTSRRQRTLEMLLDHQDDAPEQGTALGGSGAKGRASGRGQALDGLDGAPGLQEDEQTPSAGLRSQQTSEKPSLTERRKDSDDFEPRLDVVFDGFGVDDDKGILDEMEPPLPSQTILKRPVPSDADHASEPGRPKDNKDVADIFSDLLRKPALPLRDSLSEPMLPPSPPKALSAPEKRTESLSRDVRPPSPLHSKPVSTTPPAPVQRPSKTPVQSILKRKLAERSSFPVPIPKRQASVPRSESRPVPLPPQRRLRTIESNAGAQEGQKETSKEGDDPNVADIVSVAGIVAKKWAREEVGRISDGIDKLRRKISSLKAYHSKSFSNMRQKQQVADPHANVLPDEEAERQINNLGTNVVALVRRYRDTVEEREKKLKIQFTRMRTKITGQNEGLVETADVLSQLDIVGLEALKGLQPKIRKKLEIPPPLPPRQAAQAYTQPPTYALSAGIPMQQYQGSPSAPGTLGQHNDAIVRNLRRRLADLVTRSEWLGDEVKRLQGREKALFREKSAALAELRKGKRTPAVVDLTANGKGRGVRSSVRSSLPATKAGPTKPVGITKRRTRGTVTASTPSSPPSKGSGKALRKTLPRSNSKYKAPPPEPQQSIRDTPTLAAPRIPAPTATTRAPTKSQSASTIPASQPSAVPLTSPAQATGADGAKTRKVPSTLQLQMDKQASDLIALTFTVWLLQDESRSEPPSGPGERMDTWVRGCVKKCLNSALAFLTTSGGIFRARSSLKADVDNENIYTDWITAAPTDDDAIERARGNYSLWDPSLRDSEWQAEKRVLRGLNICFQKALALTPAATFSATLMYAKAILNKTIADFEMFMPVTITVLPSKPTAPPSTAPAVAAARPAKTTTPILPRPTNAAVSLGQSSVPDTAPGRAPGASGTAQGNGSVSTIPKTISEMKPVSSGGTVSGQLPVSSETQGVRGSATKIPVSAVPPASHTDVAQAPNASKPVTTTGASADATRAPAPEISSGQRKNMDQQTGGNRDSAQTSQSDPCRPSFGGSKSLASRPSQGAESIPTARDPKSNSTQLSKATPVAHHPSRGALASNTQQKAAPSLQSGSTKIATKQSAEQAPAAQDQIKTSKPANVPKQSDPPASRVAGVVDAGQKPTIPGTSASAKDSGPNRRKTGQQSKGANQEKSSGQGKEAFGTGMPTKSASQPPGKSTGGSSIKASQESQASKQNPVTAGDVLPKVSQSPSTSVSKDSAPVKLSKTTAQAADIQTGNAGMSTNASQSASRSIRTSSRVQSRVQSRSQRKSSSSSHSKATKTLESRKPVHQKETGEPVTQTPIVSTGSAQGTGSLPATRLQEVPRKHAALGAPRAPLELPRANIGPGQPGNTGASGASGPAAASTQRTYPMLSRNQVRVSNSAIPSSVMLSRNQVTAGKRPQLGTAQMSVPAAPQRRVAPGMQPTGAYGPSDGGDQMDIDAGRDLSRRRGDIGAAGTEQHEQESGRASGSVLGHDVASSTHQHAAGYPDDSDNTPGLYASNPSVNALGRHQARNVFQTTGKKQIGFKSLPMVPPRQPSQGGGAAVGGGGTLPLLGSHDRPQNSYEAQRGTSAPMEYARTSEGQASEYPYGQGGEPVYSPYNAGGQDPVDLMNPPTPASFAGLDGYGISLNAEQAPLQRDSLPATPSDFDRYGVQSPINLERQSNWGASQQQGQAQGQGQLQGQGQVQQGQIPVQGQLGHIMNPQRRDPGYNQAKRYQTRATFQGRR